MPGKGGDINGKHLSGPNPGNPGMTKRTTPFGDNVLQHLETQALHHDVATGRAVGIVAGVGGQIGDIDQLEPCVQDDLPGHLQGGLRGGGQVA